MDISHKEEQNKGQFYIEDNAGKAIASLLYKLDDNSVLVIEHTEVDPSLKGQGIGAQLVEASVKHARTNDLKIKPLCSYADAVFSKTPEYSDVLA